MRGEPEQRHAMLLRHLLRHPQQQHGNGRLACRGNGRFYSLSLFSLSALRHGEATLASRTQGPSPSKEMATRRFSLSDAVQKTEENVEVQVGRRVVVGGVKWVG